MTAWFVAGAILLLFLVLLFSPVIVIIGYENRKLTAKVRYLLILIDFSPEKLAKRSAKKAERSVKKEYKKQKKEEGTKQKKEKALEDTVKTVWSMVKATKRGLDMLRKHVVFYKIKMQIVAGGGDAEKIATNYAKICTLVSNGLALLDALFVVREPQVGIRPDFLLEKTRADFRFRVRIAPWYVISAAVIILSNVLKVILANKQKRKKVKGGKRHEPTTSHQ